jgi:hypothetical protein
VIQYRHHVISLFAVFLALAIGVVLGGGPLTEVGQGALTSAEPSESAEEEATTGDDTFGDAFALESAPRLYDGALGGHPVALVTLPGADEQLVSGLRAQVENASGTLAGTWQLEPALLDPAEKSLVDTLGSQLMTQLGDEVAEPQAPTYERMGQLLGVAVGTDEESGEPAGDNALAIRQSLAGAELVVDAGDEPRRAPLVLVVLGDDADDAVLSGLLTGLAARAGGVVVAGTTESGQDGDVAALRIQGVADDVATVDGAERSAGQVSSTMALIRSLEETGGSFGASGSDGAVPLR